MINIKRTIVNLPLSIRLIANEAEILIFQCHRYEPLTLGIPEQVRITIELKFKALRRKYSHSEFDWFFNVNPITQNKSLSFTSGCARRNVLEMQKFIEDNNNLLDTIIDCIKKLKKLGAYE